MAAAEMEVEMAAGAMVAAAMVAVMAAAGSGYVACEDDAGDAGDAGDANAACADDAGDAGGADDADGAHVDCVCGNRSRSKWTLYSGVDCCHRHNSQAHNWKYR
jgi:hypothetical protein